MNTKYYFFDDGLGGLRYVAMIFMYFIGIFSMEFCFADGAYLNSLQKGVILKFLKFLYLVLFDNPTSSQNLIYSIICGSFYSPMLDFALSVYFSGNKNVSLTFSWNTVPNAGLLPRFTSAHIHRFAFPDSYTYKRTI